MWIRVLSLLALFPARSRCLTSVITRKVSPSQGRSSRARTSIPATVTLTRDAAEYLAQIPVRAFATDAFSIANLSEKAQVESSNLTAQVVPIHHSFLSRGIPVYEQLFNVEALIGKTRMFFVGVPVNVRDGDGMNVRPVVFVY